MNEIYRVGTKLRNILSDEVCVVVVPDKPDEFERMAKVMRRGVGAVLIPVLYVDDEAATVHYEPQAKLELMK